MCRHSEGPGNVSLHTSSLDGVRFYCVKCLWDVSKDLPVTEISVDQLATSPSQINWDGTRVTQLLVNRAGEHWQRIINADISFPVLVTKRLTGYEILDGCHRTVKVWLFGGVHRVRVLAEEHLAACVLPDMPMWPCQGSALAVRSAKCPPNIPISL